MSSLLGVDTWGAWQPWQEVSTQDVTDAVVATVLGVMAPFLVLAAIGHLLIAVTVSAALLVLTATTPICAAGLVSETGRGWMWTSLRWFHAAAFTPTVVVLVTGVGVQTTTGVAAGAADGLSASLATAVPGVVLICVSCVAPLSLFKLLAFVDPGTSSGAAMRAGLAAQGGLSGLVSRGGGGISGRVDQFGGLDHRRTRPIGRRVQRRHRDRLPVRRRLPRRAGRVEHRRRRRPRRDEHRRRPGRGDRRRPGQPGRHRAQHLRPRRPPPTTPHHRRQ